MGFRQWLSKAEMQAIEAPPAPPLNEMEKDIVAILRTVFDPELPVNIYDLGLIYELTADPANGHVHLRMTLTAPGCPVAQTFPETVADAVRLVHGVQDVEVELVWEPRWSKNMMSEAARLDLGLL